MAPRRRRTTAAEFILRHGGVAPAELVRLGSDAGFEITPALIEAVRFFCAEPASPPDVPRRLEDHAPHSERRASAKLERRFVELAREIGYERAWELLELVAQLLRDGRPEKDPRHDPS